MNAREKVQLPVKPSTNAISVTVKRGSSTSFDVLDDARADLVKRRAFVGFGEPT